MEQIKELGGFVRAFLVWIRNQPARAFLLLAVVAIEGSSLKFRRSYP
jgi:hypothetical protein